MPDFDIIGQGISGGAPSGLFKSLDPAYQAQQQTVQQNQIGLDAAQAFKGGVPVNPQTGQPDYDAMSKTLMQKGDFANAEKIQQLGISMQGIGIANQAANAFGGGGAPAGGAGAAPASGQASGGGQSSDYLSRLATVENGGKDGGAPSAAGALGRFQFTASTWQGLGRKYPELNLTADGRTDPAQQQRAIVAFNNDNASALGQSGVQPTPGSMYLAHFAGASGALAALKADPSTPVSAILGPAAVKANPFLNGMTAGGLVGWANGKMSGVDPSTMFGPARPAEAGAQPAAAPPQAVAQADPTPRPAQPAAPVGTAAASPIGDDLYQTALRVVGIAQNRDPRSMTLPEQQAVTKATGIVAQYQQEQNTPPAAVAAGAPAGPAAPNQVAQNGTSDGPQPTGQHPFAPPPQPQGAAVAPGRQPPPQGMAAPMAPAQAQPAPMAQQAAAPTPAAPPQIPQPQGFGSGNTPLSNDPGVGGILRAYKGGQFAGDPGAALNDMRRMQIQLSAAGQYGTGPAAAIGKTADYLEQAITRSATLTNAQRDARDPAVMAQVQQKAQIEAQAKLQGETDLTRTAFAQNEAAAKAQGALDVSSSAQALRAKGQEAEAMAAGTQQGNNSPSAIGAAASRAAQVAEATGNGQALGKLPEMYAQASTAAQKQNTTISDMLDQASQFNMGANADREQGFNTIMSDLGHRAGVDTSDIDGKVAGYQQYVKLAGNLTRQAMKDTGGRAGGIQEMQFINNTLPSPSTSPLGFKGVAAFLQGSNDYDIAKQQAAASYQAQTGSLAGFENNFTQNVSPGATILHRLQQDQPAMFQQTVDRLKGSPAGQAVLRKAAAGLQYLSKTGAGN